MATLTKELVAHALTCRLMGSWKGRNILAILADLGFKTTRAEVAPLIAQVIAEDVHEMQLCQNDFESYCEYINSPDAPYAPGAQRIQ